MYVSNSCRRRHSFVCFVAIRNRLSRHCGSTAFRIHRSRKGNGYCSPLIRWFLTKLSQEKSILFRRYLSIHTIMTLAVFSLAAAWTIVSATRHSTAKSDCINDFFDTSNSDQADEADTLCQIFPWVDVGIMGGLWVLFAIVHVRQPSDSQFLL